jgi:serine/threonine protein kinase
MGSSSTQNDGSQASQRPKEGDAVKRNVANEETVFTGADVSSPAPSAAALGELPSQFGRYRIIRRLGSGGMGSVYLALDTQLDRDVALKVPRFGRDESSELIDRFFREARSMATLRHPNLCAVYDVGEQDGTCYLTMAYIDGRELSAVLNDRAAADAHPPVPIVRKVALALGEAHQAGVVHRDLKPSNIMIDRRGEPVVMDFGLARRDRKGEAEITQTGAIVGTPAYMPPEQIEGGHQSAGPTADVYSLGVIFYQLLCGRLPFEGTVTSVLAQVLTKEPPPPSQFRSNVDAQLEAICLRAMAKSPAERYQSMAEFVAALDAWQTVPEQLRSRQRREAAALRPAVVPGCRHDLFISYCAADDEPPPGSAVAGWVTTLVDNLDWRLRQLSGRSAELSVWMDDGLANRPEIDDAAAERLERTAATVLVMSPGYANSGWLQTSGRFLDVLRRRHLRDECVFVVERDRVEPHLRPADLAALRGHSFWRPAGESAAMLLGYPRPRPEADAEYYARVDDLARAVHERLNRLIASRPDDDPRRAGSVSEQSAPAADAPGSPCIYLAEVTDDLDPLRDEVQRYLNQFGYRVLPSRWYPRDPGEFQEAMQHDMQQCLLFVQLVGPFAGKKPPGETRSYAALQYEIAERSGLPILQWRDAALQTAGIRDPEHSALLGNRHVQVVDLELFKRETVTRAAQERKRYEQSQLPPAPAADKAFIFINAGRDDLPLTEELCELLERHGYSYALPMHDGRPDEIRQDLEANLLDCDGLIVVYGEIPEQWVREQLRQWRKVLFRREKPLRALAVYEGPPPQKQRLGMRLPQMRVLDCRQGLQVEKVRSFLESLAGK